MNLNYKKLFLGNKTKKTIIFIHGFGASGEDLLGLAPYFQEFEKDLLAISPDAPNKNDFMENSYYWFPLENWSEEYLSSQLDKVLPILDNFIKDIIKKYQIAEQDIILCGFSQGSLLAIEYALIKAQKDFFAVIAFSGGVLPNIKQSIKNKTPICLIHGKDDDVLPCDYSQIAAQIFEQQEHNFEIKLIDNLAHSINKEGVDFALDFLKKL